MRSGTSAQHAVREVFELLRRQGLGEGVRHHVLGVAVDEAEFTGEYTLAEHVVAGVDMLGALGGADGFADADAGLVVFI